MKLVLTGGPSGGKTTLAQMVQRELTPQILMVPEAASLIFNGGFPRRADESVRLFQQRAIYYVQRELEGLHAHENPQAHLLCDRGSLDGLAYLPSLEEPFLQSLNTTREKEIARYEWVIHLDTAGPGFYDTSNPVRIESFDQALELNNRVRKAWSGHPQRFVITNSQHFSAKVDLALDMIRGILKGHSYTEIKQDLVNVPFLEK